MITFRVVGYAVALEIPGFKEYADNKFIAALNNNETTTDNFWNNLVFIDPFVSWYSNKGWTNSDFGYQLLLVELEDGKFSRLTRMIDNEEWRDCECRWILEELNNLGKRVG